MHPPCRSSIRRTYIRLLALAAAVFPSAVFAHGAEQRFTRDGITYVYAVSPAVNGRQVIEGRRLPSGSAFRLVVTGDRVDGVSGGQPVAFRRAVPVGVQVAAR